MAINERLVHTASAAAGGGTGNQEEGLILHLDANDVDSYDGDGTEWVDIANHEYTPSTDVSEHFNTVIYNGNGSSSGQAITGVGFKPDLVWVKKRNATGRHQIQHSLEDGWGDSSDAIPYAPSQAHIDFRPVSTFDSDGFTIPTNYTYNNHVSGTYVAWCFKAGGAPSGSDKVSIDGTSYATMSAAGLTDGTIAVDKLSVNRDLGFSVIQLDNKVTHPDKTIAHGLGVSPEMIIWKRTDSTGHWYVYHKGIGEAKHVILNSQAAAVSTPDWVESTPNSTTFDVSWSSGGRDYIAYCFASKRGVSKVGSYTGTGASNKVVTGFEPAFIIGKCTSNSPSNWWIFDNKREDEVLYPNLINDQDLLSDYVSFDRDGFTLSNAAFVNQSGRDYIYYAVAKNTNETSLTPTKDDFTAGSVETTNLELDLDANSYSGSGDWLDGTSNDNDGTITGASYVNDGSADYFSFDGSNDFVDLADIAGFGTELSLELWVNPNNSQNQYSTLVDFQHSNDEGWVVMQDNNNVNQYRFSLKDGSAYDSSSNLSLVSGAWNHLSITVDSSGNMKFYLNGELEQSLTGFGGLGVLVRRLNLCCWGGADGVTRSRFWNGQIGQVRIYSSALTPAQIQSNYEATKIYNTPDLQLNLDAGDDDSTSSNWQDLSSNDYTATFTSITYDEELGNSYNFVGGSSEVLLNDSGSLTNNANFTVEMWLNSTDNSDYQELWGSMNNAGGARQIYARTGPDDKIEITAYSSNSSNDYRQVKTINAVGSKIYGKWAHLSIVMSNQKITGVYINGESEPITTLGGASHLMHLTSTTNFGIGGWQNAGTGVSFNGNIGQVRMYHSALTQAQIRQNYNYTKPNYPNGNDGTLVGLTSSDWNTDGYFTFNGTSDYLTTSLKLDTSNAFSFAVWFRPNAADNSNYQILIGNNSGSTPFGGVAIALLGASDVIAPVNGGTTTGYGTYTNGIWNHAVYTHDGQGNLKLYLNDSEVSSFNTGGYVLYTANQTIKIGDTDIGTWNHFTGDISDVKVYDRELSSEEVTAQFAIKQFDIG